MKSEKRHGNQEPNELVVQPYTMSHGEEAIEIYESSDRELLPWQKQGVTDILAYNEEGLYVHDQVGFSVQRRNGKTEIIVARILYGLKKGENGLYTAHLVDSSTDASEKVARVLDEMGYEEVVRLGDGLNYEKIFVFKKQRGAQRIILYDKNGKERCYCDFRTRSGQGGLGKGYDYLIVDEAQEYTKEQQTALKYVISASKNPQKIFLGTPPTTVSKGTVFMDFRKDVLSGKLTDSVLWFAWAIPNRPKDIRDVDLWYEYNPSLGYHLSERAVKAELGDEDDFIIQRLGWWTTYNLCSAITEEQWKTLILDESVKVESKLYIGIKYSLENTVALSICVKTNKKPFIESIDCRSINDTNKWLVEFCKRSEHVQIIIDGESGRDTLKEELEANKIKDVYLVNVEEFKNANEVFRNGIIEESFYHNNQPSLTNIATNCDKRPIGSKGGYGYKSIKSDADIALLDSAILAYWGVFKFKDKPKKRIRMSF